MANNPHSAKHFDTRYLLNNRPLANCTRPLHIIGASDSNTVSTKGGSGWHYVILGWPNPVDDTWVTPIYIQLFKTRLPNKLRDSGGRATPEIRKINWNIAHRYVSPIDPWPWSVPEEYGFVGTCRSAKLTLNVNIQSREKNQVWVQETSSWPRLLVFK